jgi:hypothetical protein
MFGDDKGNVRFVFKNSTAQNAENIHHKERKEQLPLA